MPPDRAITRRALLLGAASVGLLGACARGEGTTAPDEDPSDAGAGASEGAGILRLFQDGSPVGREVRLPFGVGDAEGIPASDGPASLTFRIANEQGEVIDEVTADRHGEGIPRIYYPVRVTLPEVGVYDVTTRIGDVVATSAITAVPAEQAPPIPSAGDPMPAIVTPTPADPRGVDPICTRQPPCPLHEIRADEALAAGQPMAFLIATPALCQTAVCGPTVELLIDEQGQHGDLALIHAEVYTDLQATETTDAVQATGLTFEPSLFLVGAGGRVRDRLDFVFDAAEVRDALVRTATA